MREHERLGTEAWDGMRGMAILMVVAFHTWLFSWLTPALSVAGIAVPVDVFPRTGYLGVELFFVISGFVLFLPDARAALGRGRALGLREFARRRAIKIVPSYAAALVVTAVVALPAVQPTSAFAGAVINHVLFVQNFWDDAFGSFNSVFWSLAIEVQFYLVFPALAWAFVRMPFVVAPAMVTTAVWYRYGVVGRCLQLEPVTRQLPAFLDLFACGMAAAYLLVWLRANVARIERYAPLATVVAVAAVAGGVALLVSANAVAYVPGGKEHWLVSHRTLFGLDAALFGLASCLAAGWWRRLIANPVLTFLAAISYNLYLWHTLVLIWMLNHELPPAQTANPHDDPQWRIAYVASGWTVCLLVATAATYFIERPALARIKPQRFAFNRHFMRGPSTAPSEKRT